MELKHQMTKRLLLYGIIYLKKPFPLPEGVFAVSKYVKGPKEIQLFLSQVGIVTIKKQGNKYQKSLRPGQVLVSKMVNYGDGMV